MIQHLFALRHDPDMRTALAAHGRATITARHTCAHRVDELLAIYAGLRSNSAPTQSPFVSSEVETRHTPPLNTA